MVEKKLQFAVQCGEKTCSYGYRKWCKHLGTRRFGSVPVCMLFQKDLEYDDKFKALRCTMCLESEVTDECEK